MMNNGKVSIQKTILTAILIGLFFPIAGGALQFTKGLFILQNRPTSADYIVGALICYFIEGFLFALGFIYFNKHLPGKTARQKGFLYGLLVAAAVYFFGIVAFIGIEYNESFLSWAKYDSVFTALVDGFLLISAGTILGNIFKDDPLFEDEKIIKVKLGWSTLLITALAFCSNYLVFIFLDLFSPSGYIVPPEHHLHFHFFIWFFGAIGTGIFTPIFYQYVHYKFSGNWYQKGLKFAAAFIVFYWIPLFLFFLPFEFKYAIENSLVAAVFSFAAFTPGLILIIFISAYTIEVQQKTDHTTNLLSKMQIS